MTWFFRLLTACLFCVSPALGFAHDATDAEPLAVIGPASAFTLTNQDGKRVALADLHDKVLAVTFGYTACPDICPLLTEKLVGVQDTLGDDAGKIEFVFISLDPERDTPAVLKDYAQAWDGKLDGWEFLTGTPAEIGEVMRHYGVFAKTAPEGSVEHTQLTSLIDGSGRLRVQYAGFRFDPHEFRGDLLSLVRER